MNRKLSFAILASFIFFAACSPTIQALRPGQLVLKPGESATSADGTVSVTFVEVVQDSRCPSDVMCVWAGNVQILIEVRQGTEDQQFTLTLGQLLEGDISIISLPLYTITLKNVQPYPISSRPTDPADYQITLLIS